MNNETTHPSGLKIKINVEGKGAQPAVGQTIVAHYHGSLEDGTKFDSSFDRNQPFEFPVGQGRVIKGWDEAFLGMTEGTHATITVPPELGYGSRDMGKIPPNSTLIFDVELLEVK
jgi:peptidylprolyl isomerase